MFAYPVVHAGGLRDLASGGDASSLASGSAGNAAGVIEYCLKNNYLGGDAASSMKDELGNAGIGADNNDEGFDDGAKDIVKTQRRQERRPRRPLRRCGRHGRRRRYQGHVNQEGLWRGARPLEIAAPDRAYANLRETKAAAARPSFFPPSPDCSALPMPAHARIAAPPMRSVSSMRYSSVIRLLLPTILLLSGCASHTTDVPLANAGFEETGGDAQHPIPGWNLAQHAGAPAYEMAVDTQTAASGHASFRMHRLTPQFYGSIAQRVAVPPGNGGKYATLSARMKTRDVGRKGWVLVMTVIATSGNKQVRAEPLSGSHEFGNVEVQTKLPDDVQAIEASALLLDEGSGWLDDVRLTIDGG